MATLKSKRMQEAKIENLSKEAEKTNKKSKKTAPVEEEVTPVVETTPETPVEETPVSSYMTEAEQNVLAEQAEKDSAESKKVSIVKMERAVEVVSDHFNLYDKNFVVNGFADKGTKCQLSMSNGDFDLVVTVKDTEKFGIM